MPFSSGNSPLSVKLALISTGVLSFAVIFKISVPAVTDFAVSEVPVMYSSFISWLRPPYIYLVVNGIIISIVASSKIQLQKADKTENFKKPLVVHPPQPSAVVADKFPADLPAEFTDGGSIYQDLNSVATAGRFTVGDNDEKAPPSETVPPPPPPLRSDSMEEEKSLVSKRFGQNKSAKASPEVLGVSKSKRQDTLENTWRKITDGRAMPLNRHLKKSETWDTKPAPPRRAEKMKKSETLSEKRSESRLRKEPSLSQEELNRRVEAFINKFNEEMRLQRQESLNQYQQMIARGAY